MSDWITLTPRRVPDGPIEMDALAPHLTADMNEGQIAALRVMSGRDHLQLGELFEIRGSASSRIRIEGATPALVGLGAGMQDGELVADGDAGARAGAGMAGGTLHVRGNAGDAAGLGMAGGILRIDGNAGARLAAAPAGAAKGMTGGEVIVLGSAGDEAGARLRRGLVAVAGSVGANAGRAMIAGTLAVLGNVGEAPGRGSKRGSILACGTIAVPATYRYACTYEPGYVRLLLLHLRRRHDIAVPDSVIDGRFRRYCGDAGEPGKGEILVLDR